MIFGALVLLGGLMAWWAREVVMVDPDIRLTRDERDVLAWLAQQEVFGEAGKAYSVREIQMAIRSVHPRFRRAEPLRTTVAILVFFGLVEEIPPPTPRKRGRPTTRYRATLASTRR